MKTDDYPGETTWKIKKDGQVVASGGPYNNGATDYMESFCLEDGSYTFTLLDSAEDGICCGYGEGDYSLIVEGQTIVDGQGEFGRSEVTAFTIGGEAPTTTTTEEPTTVSKKEVDQFTPKYYEEAHLTLGCFCTFLRSDYFYKHNYNFYHNSKYTERANCQRITSNGLHLTLPILFPLRQQRQDQQQPVLLRQQRSLYPTAPVGATLSLI